MCGWREGKGGAHCAPSTSTTIDEAAAGVSDTTVSLSESELFSSGADPSWIAGTGACEMGMWVRDGAWARLSARASGGADADVGGGA